MEIIGVLLAIIIPIIIWLRKSYFVGPTLVVEIKRSGFTSSPQGPSWKNEFVDGGIHIKDALYVYKLEWHFQIIIRNNSEHTAYCVKIAFEEGNNPFSRHDVINELIPRKATDEIVLDAFVTAHEECLPKNRTDAAKIPDQVERLRILLEYKNSSGAVFFTLYDNAAEIKNDRLRIRPKRFLNEERVLKNAPRNKSISVAKVLTIAASIASIIATAILLWQVFFS